MEIPIPAPQNVDRGQISTIGDCRKVRARLMLYVGQGLLARHRAADLTAGNLQQQGVELRSLISASNT